ncbi:MAG: hypothetical protein ILP12_03860 [Lachnospiraceae bacterium]|nr:hypothetical protein [Lachnospiraceae bacterium]
MREEQSEDVLVEREVRRHSLIRRLLIIGGILIVLGIAAFLWVRSRRRVYTEAELIRKTDQSAAASVYTGFAGGVLRCSPGGLALVGADGHQLWNSGHSMDSPSVTVQEGFGVAADLLGYQAVIFDKNGVTGRITTNEPIHNAAVSSHGVTALVLDSEQSSRIVLFDKTGRQLEITVSLSMSVSGYPLDLALSPEGTGLVVSAVSSTSGALRSQIVFYNFSVGKGESNRLVGYFEYDGVLFPEVAYLSDKRVAAIGEDRIVFFSLNNEADPERLKEVSLSAQIQSVSRGSGHLALVQPASGGSQSQLLVFDAGGSELFKATIPDVSLRTTAGPEYVLMVTDSGLKLWDYSGRLRFDGKLTYPGQEVFALDSRTLLQFDGAAVVGYRLK